MSSEPTDVQTRREDWNVQNILLLVFGVVVALVTGFGVAVYIVQLASGRAQFDPALEAQLQRGLVQFLLTAMSIISVWLGALHLSKKSETNNRKTQNVVKDELNGKLHAKIKDAVAAALAEQKEQ